MLSRRIVDVKVLNCRDPVPIDIDLKTKFVTCYFFLRSFDFPIQPNTNPHLWNPLCKSYDSFTKCRYL